MTPWKSLAVTVAAFALPGAVNASVIYNLTLTDSSNPAFNGMGSITLNTAPTASGQTDYAQGDFSDLTFTIGGQTFTPALNSVSAVRFLDGAFNDITFSQTIGTSPDRYALMMSGVYAFYYNDLQSVAYGTITSAPATTTAVPEAATWAMMLAGFGFIGGALRRRRRTSVTFG